MSDPISFKYSRIEPSLYWKAVQAASQSSTSSGYRKLFILGLVWLLLVALTVFALQFEFVERGGGAFLAGVSLTFVGIFLWARVQRVRLNRILQQEQDLRGHTTIELGPDGCRFSSSFGTSHLEWRAINAILDLGSGTGLRSGFIVFPLPNEQLPENITPETLRQALEAWRSSNGSQP